jgi:Deoxycytidine deaminase
MQMKVFVNWSFSVVSRAALRTKLGLVNTRGNR